MKRISVHLAIALLLCVVSAASVSAKVKSRAYTVGQNFVLAGTTVKAGTYEFRFDDEKNELSVVDRKTKEVLARADARAEAWEKGSGSLGLQLTGNAAPLSFDGIAFDGKQIVRVSASAAQGK
jgi:hypothetical protein